MTSTIEDRAREVATHLLARGFPTGPLIDNTSTVADTLTTFAKDEVEKALEEAVMAVGRLPWIAPVTDDVVDAIDRCNEEIKESALKAIRALKEGSKP